MNLPAASCEVSDKESVYGFRPDSLKRVRSKLRGIKPEEIDKRHHKAQTSHKNSKIHRLTHHQKQKIKRLARECAQWENTFAFFKSFTILQGPYRNRTKRSTLRFNLIAALQNGHL